MKIVKNKIFWVVVLVVFFAGIFYWQRNKSASVLGEASPVEESLSSLTAPSPTPFEFQEVTIPYLRQRKYESALGELEKNYDGQNYTAYLTSYDSDGLRVNGLLTRPNSQVPTGGWPAIIFIHGYIPPTQYNTLQNYYSYVDYLARNGFVVFKIDLRGHANSEGEPGGAYFSADYIIDTLNAYSALQKSDFVDPNKIGLWGHSMAGNVVMRSLAVKPEIPAVVIWAGAVYSYADREEFGINDSSYRPPGMSNERQRRRQRLTDLYGEANPEHFFWRQLAPTSYLSDLRGAIQIHHAVDDAVVDIGYSRGLVNLLKNTGVKHELHEYQSGGHNISGSAYNEAMSRTAEFFRNNL